MGTHPERHGFFQCPRGEGLNCPSVFPRRALALSDADPTRSHTAVRYSIAVKVPIAAVWAIREPVGLGGHERGALIVRVNEHEAVNVRSMADRLSLATDD